MVLVEYTTDARVLHSRLILLETTAKTMTAVTGEEAADPASPIRWILTPDGDVYPEELSCPPLKSLSGLDANGERFPLDRRRLGHRSAQVYGFKQGRGGGEITVQNALQAAAAAADADSELNSVSPLPLPLDELDVSFKVGSGPFPGPGIGHVWQWRSAKRADPGVRSAAQWIRCQASLVAVGDGGLYEATP
eukprot:5569122-Heterocapsa_arctica.AAC.1